MGIRVLSLRCYTETVLCLERRGRRESGLLNKEISMSREDDDFFDVETSPDDTNDNQADTSEVILNDSEDETASEESQPEADEPRTSPPPRKPRAKPKPSAAAKAKTKPRPKMQAKAKQKITPKKK